MTRFQTETHWEINWQRPFFTIWTGQALSLFGSHIGSFALIWWLTETTGSATILATAILVTLLPDVILGPVIGTFVDRWNRRWIMFSADTMIAILSAVLAYLQILLFPAISLQPILVTQYFNGNAFLLAWFSAAFGIGIVVGGLILSAWGGGKQRIITSMGGVMGIGVGILLVGLTPVAIPWLALIGLMIAGAMNSVSNAPIFAMLQDKVAPEMQGRVFSLLMSLSGVATPIAMLIAGPVSDIIGVQVWYMLAGIMCLLIGIYGLSSATIRHLEQNHETIHSPA